jgi:hypothetical protein
MLQEASREALVGHDPAKCEFDLAGVNERPASSDPAK